MSRSISQARGHQLVRNLGLRHAILAILSTVTTAGCYAPLHSRAVDATRLSDEFRIPTRTTGPKLNFAQLVVSSRNGYVLGTGDRLSVTIPDLIDQGNAQTFDVLIHDEGDLYLPRVGKITVGGMTLSEAQVHISETLSKGLLKQPGVSVSLIDKGTINVMVLGSVRNPGSYSLPRDESDIAHAIASAGGFSEEAADLIEVHRRKWLLEKVPPSPTESVPLKQLDEQGQPLQDPGSAYDSEAKTEAEIELMAYETEVPEPGRLNPYGSYRNGDLQQVSHWNETPRRRLRRLKRDAENHVPKFIPPMNQTHLASEEVGDKSIIRIPLRGEQFCFNPENALLRQGDVIIVPDKQDEVFYVVGPLSNQNRIRFSANDRDRELGSGLLLPDDREIDVVQAVAMAGYIDPIESPTTVTVHRTRPDGTPMLINVDLIAARYDPKATILIQPGDIVYLNPDAKWYLRRLADRVIDRALGAIIGRALFE